MSELGDEREKDAVFAHTLKNGGLFENIRQSPLKNHLPKNFGKGADAWLNRDESPDKPNEPSAWMKGNRARECEEHDDPNKPVSGGLGYIKGMTSTVDKARVAPTGGVQTRARGLGINRKAPVNKPRPGSHVHMTSSLPAKSFEARADMKDESLDLESGF